MDIKESILDKVRNTPLVRLRRVGTPEGVKLFAKLGGANPMGSEECHGAPLDPST